MPRRKLVAGNWKMNGLRAAQAELDALRTSMGSPNCDVLICPPTTLLMALAGSAAPVAIGGQDCHAKASGAHTGDISAEMLADAGASAVILGHSERRADHGETSLDVAAKTQAAWRAGLMAIVCVGETEAQRMAGQATEIVGAQLADSLPDGATAANLVVAYEPVWAIGTGKVPTLAEIGEIHSFMRDELTKRFSADIAQGIRLLYGGSVKPGNAAELFAVADVDGALVGGASLKAADFAPIIAAA